MPIAINGSGTVTGISVGGLPDGIVDTDMIAAAAVTGPKKGVGSILQVVSASTTTTVSNTTTTFADTGLTATISISAGSKVFIIMTQMLDVERGGATEARCAVKLLRGSTDIYAPGNAKNIGIEGSSATNTLFLPLTYAFLDTGASTGSNTYKTQARVTTSGRIRTQDDSNPSTMTLLEIA